MQVDMVGRKSQLLCLERAWQQACDGQGRCVLVEGPAGMGKTTLLRRFLAAPARQDIFCLQGTGYCLHDDLLYAPLLEAFDDFFHTREQQEVAAWCAGLDELCHWFPWLPQPHSAPSEDPALGRVRLFRCFVELMNRIAKERPVVLVLEDLHWADEVTQELFHTLARSLRHRRVMLLATIRTEALETDLRFQQFIFSLKRVPATASLQLEPLDSLEMQALIRSRLGAEGSPRLCEMLFAQSAGVPFFLCGLLDTLEQSQALFFDGALWRFLSSSFPLPRSVQELVAERLSLFSQEDTELLSFLSVGAQVLRHKLILQLSNLPVEQIDSGLLRLTQHGVLEEFLWQGEEAYRWTHPLFQQGVYDALSIGTRRRMHAAFVEVLEQQEGSSALLLAHHYKKMGTLAHHERAFEVLCEAGMQTKRLESLPESEAHWRMALEVAQALPTLAEYVPMTKLSLGEVLFLRGDVPSAIAYYNDVLCDCDRHGSPLYIAQTHLLLAHARWGQAAFAQALEHLQAGLDVLPSGDEHQSIRERLHIDQLVFLDRSAQFDRLHERLVHHRGSRLHASPHFQVALGVIELGAALREGRYLEARQQVEGLQSIADATGEHVQSIRVRNFASLVATAMGEHEEAMAHMRDNLTLVRERGLLWCEPSVLGAGGVACLAKGELDEALRLADQAISISRRIHLDRYLLRMLALRSIIFSLRGEWATARRAITEARELPIACIEDIHMAASLWLAEATYAVEAGLYDQAYAILKQLRCGQEVVALDCTIPTLLLVQWGKTFVGREELASLALVLEMFDTRREGSLYCQAWYAFFGGHKEALLQRDEQALALFDEARHLFEEQGFSLEAAKTELVWLETFQKADLSYPLHEVCTSATRAKSLLEWHGANHICERIEAVVEQINVSKGVVPQRLSRREEEVVRHLAKGLSNKEIAHHLQISHHTVATYLKRLYMRFDVHSRTALANYVQTHNLLRSPSQREPSSKLPLCS